MRHALTKSTFVDTIDNVLASASYSSILGLSLRRATDDDAWNRILIYTEVSSSGMSSLSNLKADTTPWFFGIEIIDGNGKICGVVTFNVAFSSWNGKILYPDSVHCFGMTGNIEQQLLRILARIAVKMDFARLTWTHVETPEWHKSGDNRPEMHEEVLTLCMDRGSIDHYASRSFPEMASNTFPGPFSNGLVRKAINTVLDEVNSTKKAGQFCLRLSTEADTKIIERLVQGLADYVKEPDAVLLSADDYDIDGFSLEPLFYCLIVETTNEDGELHPCGFAFFFFGYQIGKGRFVHLEDLFIESEYRQNGGGSLVMATLAKISQTLELSNFYWQALDWNTGALTFYQKMGAAILDGIKTSRYCSHPSNALEKFANGSSC
jgi:GNAT superfamily N-acetyltransferase